MRLLNVHTLEIHEFLDQLEYPPYAILSHTWEKDECSFQDMCNNDSAHRQALFSKQGYQKIKRTCEQALEDGFVWAWVDTCCIDKTSSAELSEAINSMFKWYKDSALCYAYLSDVGGEDWSTSRWFKRGWTLQELIAPRRIHFFDSNWVMIGNKNHLAEQISQVTDVDVYVLQVGEMHRVSAATRLAWASGRSTTRLEDAAYSMLGLFDVNMPLLYGEGTKAFIRLQYAIMANSFDFSMLAWGEAPGDPRHLPDDLTDNRLYVLLPVSSKQILITRKLLELPTQKVLADPVPRRGGIDITLPITEVGTTILAALPFTIRDNRDHHLCIRVAKIARGRYARLSRALILLTMDSPRNYQSQTSHIWRTRRLHFSQTRTYSPDSLYIGLFFGIGGVALAPQGENETQIIDFSECKAMADSKDYAIEPFKCSVGELLRPENQIWFPVHVWGPVGGLIITSLHSKFPGYVEDKAPSFKIDTTDLTVPLLKTTSYSDACAFARCRIRFVVVIGKSAMEDADGGFWVKILPLLCGHESRHFAMKAHRAAGWTASYSPRVDQLKKDLEGTSSQVAKCVGNPTTTEGRITSALGPYVTSMADIPWDASGSSYRLYQRKLTVSVKTNYVLNNLVDSAVHLGIDFHETLTPYGIWRR